MLGPMFWVPVGLGLAVVVALVVMGFGDRRGWWDGPEDLS